jgi:hypothetical protein
MQVNSHPLFPSLVFETDLSPFPQQQLTDIAYALKEEHPSVHVSNIGGYHSPPVQLDIEPVDSILKQILSCSYEITNTWFIINSSCDYNSSHNHPQSDLSGVLYVTDSDAPIEFEHPQYFQQYTLLKNITGLDDYTHQVYRITPKAGKLLLFPSSLRHRVLHNNSTDDRISISFNIKLNESSN